MKKSKIQSYINIILIVWISIWFYYLLFNWDVFIIQLKTNLGFNTISLHPFLFFFVIGTIGFIVIKYLIHFYDLQNDAILKENKNKKSILEKDIEILKLREALYKMHSDGMNKNAGVIGDLHSKLDNLSKKIANEKNETNSETDS